MSQQTQQDQRYNGWTNYETWGVALVLDNDEGTYTMARERAAEIKAEAPNHANVPEIWTEQEAARFELADWLRDFTETLCGVGSESDEFGIPEPSLMAQQLLQGALSDVDWDEIASTILSES